MSRRAWAKKSEKRSNSRPQQVKQLEILHVALNCTSQWAHIPEDIFVEMLPYLSMEDLLRLSAVCKWFYLCVHEITRRKNYTHRYHENITFPKQLWCAQKNIQNFMRWVLPAWPCIMFHIDVGESWSMDDKHLSKYAIPNLWVKTDIHHRHGREIIKSQAIHSLTIETMNRKCCILKDVSQTLRELHLKYVMLTNLNYPWNGLIKVNLDCCHGSDHIPSELAVHTLRVERCDELSKVDNLCNVYDLSLLYCVSVTDVSALNRVHTLDLTWCTSVTDVSALGYVYALKLNNCKFVTDVSALGNVHTLDLTWCKWILDVSMLKGVHTLNLSHCRRITDVSALGDLHSLDLTWCWRVTDVSALGRVHSLTLIGCHQVSDVHALGHVHSLDLRRTAVKDVSALSNTSRLCIACTGVTDVSMLGFGVKIIISPCMATPHSFHPKIIHQDGQNICIIARGIYLDRYLQCSVCFPFDEYDFDSDPYDSES